MQCPKLPLWLAGLALLSLASLPGCTAKRIPGLSIDVEDTPDNRAIVQLLRDYVVAYEAKDLERLVAFAADDYYETAGTPDTGDDYNKDGLRTKMAEYFKTIEKPSLSINLKALKVDEEKATATVDYQYVCRYLMKLPSGER